MSSIRTYPYQNSAVLRIHSEKEYIQTNPEYQRKGDIWNLEKKQLLIDSILNNYDIPKLYFHLLSNKRKKDTNIQYDYAIIDGRQRLEAIWDFIDGQFSLSENFEFLADKTVKAQNMSFSELAENYPKLKIYLESFSLPIVVVETEDLDLIEDMFSRLNEAVPLNATEKRNAFGGDMVTKIRILSEHNFFEKKVRFSNSRYQHREVATRLLFLEDSFTNNNGKIIDTKKPFLDKFVKTNSIKTDRSEIVYDSTFNTLTFMESIFNDKDPLLRAQGIIPIYYFVARNALNFQEAEKFSNNKLIEFREALDKNRRIAEMDVTTANFDLLEFERLSQQGTNDASSIRERIRILSLFLGIKNEIL